MFRDWDARWVLTVLPTVPSGSFRVEGLRWRGWGQAQSTAGCKRCAAYRRRWWTRSKELLSERAEAKLGYWEDSTASWSLMKTNKQHWMLNTARLIYLHRRWRGLQVAVHSAVQHLHRQPTIHHTNAGPKAVVDEKGGMMTDRERS